MREDQYLYTCSKNDAILSVRKHYCAIGFVLGLRLGLEEDVRLMLELSWGLRKYVFN